MMHMKGVWCSEGGLRTTPPQLSITRWRRWSPGQAGLGPPLPPNPQGPRQSQRSPPHSSTLTRQVHGNRRLAGCSPPAIFRSCADLGKPITVPRPVSSSVVRGDTLLIVPPHRTVIIVQWDVCETMKQQKNLRNSMIRNNNLFGNTFLNVFNTLFHLPQMLKQTTSRTELRCWQRTG